MTAREWVVVALRALLSLLFGAVAAGTVNYGGWFLLLAIVCAALSVVHGLIAYARYHDFRFHAEYRRQLR